ncbi:MAG: hypothetical protein SFU98_15730 [Leptospiraceae bacterium]|nr:hypothetical protein [Leptospiraceae bacterium]
MNQKSSLFQSYEEMNDHFSIPNLKLKGKIHHYTNPFFSSKILIPDPIDFSNSDSNLIEKKLSLLLKKIYLREKTLGAAGVLLFVPSNSNEKLSQILNSIFLKSKSMFLKNFIVLIHPKLNLLEVNPFTLNDHLSESEILISSCFSEIHFTKDIPNLASEILKSQFFSLNSKTFKQKIQTAILFFIETESNRYPISRLISRLEKEPFGINSKLAFDYLWTFLLNKNLSYNFLDKNKTLLTKPITKQLIETNSNSYYIQVLMEPLK